jgi:hypothetical protein
VHIVGEAYILRVVEFQHPLLLLRQRRVGNDRFREAWYRVWLWPPLNRWQRECREEDEGDASADEQGLGESISGGW